MTGAITEGAVAGLIAKQEITEVLYRYCRACDRLDEALLRTCFHPDSVHAQGPYKGPSENYFARVVQIVSALDQCSHMVSNPLIELRGDVAVSECLFVAHQRWTKPGDPRENHRIVKGRYLDRFEKRQGVWKIARRIGIHQDIREFSLDPPATAPEGEKAGKKPNDPLYELLAGLPAARS